MKEGKYKMGKNPWVSFDKLTEFKSTNSSLDNFKNGLKINISKTKTPIKKLIKEYNKKH